MIWNCLIGLYAAKYIGMSWRTRMLLAFSWMLWELKLRHQDGRFWSWVSVSSINAN